MKKRRRKSIGRHIYILQRFGQIHLGRQMEHYGIPKGHFVFLAALLDREGISQDELAALVHVDKASTARGLKRLETAGYVRRKQDTGDRRINRVFLTSKAKEFEPTFRRILAAWTDALLEGFTTEERRMSFRLLERMTRNVSRLVESNGS